MELLVGERIALTPRPVRTREAALEVALLGHAPGRVRLDRLRALAGVLDEMRDIGFGATVDAMPVVSAVQGILRGEVKQIPALVQYAEKGSPVGSIEKSDCIEALREYLPVMSSAVRIQQANELLQKAADELLMLKALGELLNESVLRALADKDVEKHRASLLSALELLLQGKNLHDSLPAKTVDALIRCAKAMRNSTLFREAMDKSALIAAVTLSLDRLLWGQAADLYHLPLPLHSSAEFHDIFPDADQAPDRLEAPRHYESLLAGRQPWLAQAVADFFANGGEKLWVVRIPNEVEVEGPPGAAQREFLPAGDTRLHEVETLRGLAAVLVIPSLAVVAMPDLERLQVPPRLPDVPRVQLDNPDPRFLPCGTSLVDDHRERRSPGELENMPDPLPFEELLRGILPFLARHRPDVQCLLTLPLAYSGEVDSPAPDGGQLARLADIRRGANGHLLRHVQLLFPYLRGPRFALRSPVGVIAGKQAAVARNKGPWRSIGAQPLFAEGLPYPQLASAERLALREDPGVGVLTMGTGFAGRRQLCLDDERLAVPALPPQEYAGAEDMSRFDGFRAAEVMRFLGFLRRRLRALGDQLVFNADVLDPRPRLLLEQFFRRLYNQGAFRGRTPEEAYRIRQSVPQEGAIQFDIEVAPAFPIDRIFLTFINADGEWRAEVNGA